jgi:hypothetical protein
MRLLILVGMRPSYRNYHDYNVQLQLAGYEPTYLIVIDDSDNENKGDIGLIVPITRRNS